MTSLLAGNISVLKFSLNNQVKSLVLEGLPESCQSYLPCLSMPPPIWAVSKRFFRKLRGMEIQSWSDLFGDRQQTQWPVTFKVLAIVWVGCIMSFSFMSKTPG